MPLPGVRTIPVPAPSRRYDVTVGQGLYVRLGEVVRSVLGERPKRAAIIADKNLPGELLSPLDVSLSRSGFFVARIGLDATEANKSLRTLESVLAFLAAMKLERDEPVIAVGGGIVGDLAGFAAAVHRRGCPLIQCPTTLLAMVDASVGGKTGVNLSLHTSGPGEAGTLLKNAAGAFWQPHAVVADIDSLASLSPRQFNAGLAECVKHALLEGMLGTSGLLDWMESSAKCLAPAGTQSSGKDRHQSAAPTTRGPNSAPAWPQASLAELISRNIAIKAKVVEADEREELPASGATAGIGAPPRALLNLGHTFAHAIETLPGLSFHTCEGQSTGPLLHGEAVAIGLVAACRTAAALNMCDAALAPRIESLLSKCNLPTAAAGLPPTDAILARMQHDKKTQGGRLRLVLPTTARGGLLTATVVEDPATTAVLAGLDAMHVVIP